MTSMWKAHLDAYRLKHPRVDYKTAQKRASKTYQKTKNAGMTKTRQKSFLDSGWGDIYNLITNPIDHLLLSEAPQISKIQCGSTCVNLIGETHNFKLRSQFLSKFLDQMKLEGQNPQSVILVEARPWEKVKDDKAYRELRYPNVTNEEVETFLCNNKDKVAPIGYFITALAWDKGKFLLPHHKIVPFDYRLVDTVQGIVGLVPVLNVMKGVMLGQNPTPDEFLERPFHSTPPEFEKSLDEQVRRLSPGFFDQRAPIAKKLVNDFKDKAKYAKQRLLNRPTGTGGFISFNNAQEAREHFTFMKDAKEIVNDLFTLFTKIPEVMLVSHVQHYVQEGIPNIYVFIGRGHIPGVERLLRETLACV